MYRIAFNRHAPRVRVTFVCLLLFLIACDQQTEPTRVGTPPIVSVADVQVRTIPVYIEFPGSIEAVKSVELLARVEGFLKSRNFEEGSTVRTGDLLYGIDPKPYEAALKKTEGQLIVSKAALANAKHKLERQRPLVEKSFISKQAFDNFLAQVKEKEGQVKADQAAVDQARLNLSYCSIHAPFNGRIGYTAVNVGNLVTPSENPKLARLVQMDPIYVVFRPSDKQLPRMSEQQSKTPIQVSVVLSDKSQYGHIGEVDAIDNRIDPSTNTIKMRGVMPNPDGLLIPGEFVKVRAFLGNQGNTVLVPQAALSEQQGGYRVFVVGTGNVVSARQVTLGATYQGMRVILDGLTSGERVVVSGLQKLKSGTKIQLQSTANPENPKEILPKITKPVTIKPDSLNN